MSHYSGTIKPSKSYCDMTHACSPNKLEEQTICGYGDDKFTCTSVNDIDYITGSVGGKSCPRDTEGVCMWYKGKSDTIGYHANPTWDVLATCAPPITPDPCQYAKPGGQWCPWGRITEGSLKNGMANTNNFYPFNEIRAGKGPVTLPGSPYNYGWPVRCDGCAANTLSSCSDDEICGFNGKSDCAKRQGIKTDCQYNHGANGVCAWYRRGPQDVSNFNANLFKDEMLVECAKQNTMCNYTGQPADPQVCCPAKKDWCRYGRPNDQGNNFYNWYDFGTLGPTQYPWPVLPAQGPFPAYAKWPAADCTYECGGPCTGG